MAKVLVTGANGFLGSWMVRRLLADGHHVRILTRASSNLDELQGLEFERVLGDITDLDSLKTSVQGIETVFHLAGAIAYKRSDRPLMDKVNVGGTKNVVEVLSNSSVSKLVYASSVVAVGAGFFPDEILNESSAFNLSHLNLGYFETKHQAEILVQKAVQENKIQAVILNPSTIYGPGDAKKGSRKTQVKVAQGQFPFYTKGGVNVIHVEDCVEGFMSAWKKGRNGERYILAGENLLIKDLFKMIADVAAVPAPKYQMPSSVLFGLGYFGDALNALGFKGGLSVENAWSSQLYHWFDNTKARTELGLKPRPAVEAIRASVGWMREKGLI